MPCFCSKLHSSPVKSNSGHGWRWVMRKVCYTKYRDISMLECHRKFIVYQILSRFCWTGYPGIWGCFSNHASWNIHHSQYSVNCENLGVNLCMCLATNPCCFELNPFRITELIKINKWLKDWFLCNVGGLLLALECPTKSYLGGNIFCKQETSRKHIISLLTEQHGRLEQNNTVLCKLDIV